MSDVSKVINELVVVEEEANKIIDSAKKEAREIKDNIPKKLAVLEEQFNSKIDLKKQKILKETINEINNEQEKSKSIVEEQVLAIKKIKVSDDVLDSIIKIFSE